MSNNNITPRLQVEAKRLAEVFPADHEWFWDDATSSLLTVLRGSECEGIQEALTNTCKTAWDHEAAEKVKSPLQGLMKKLMGVHKGQTLHTTPLSNHLTLFATYWPWVGGSRVSIRIGVYNDGAEENESGAYADALKKAFHADQPIYFRTERKAAIKATKVPQSGNEPTSESTPTTVKVPQEAAVQAALKTMPKAKSAPARAKVQTTEQINTSLDSVIQTSADLIELLKASRSNVESSLGGLKHVGKGIKTNSSKASLARLRQQKKARYTFQTKR